MFARRLGPMQESRAAAGSIVSQNRFHFSVFARDFQALLPSASYRARSRSADRAVRSAGPVTS
jgi:hypothetical protein